MEEKSVFDPVCPPSGGFDVREAFRTLQGKRRSYQEFYKAVEELVVKYFHVLPMHWYANDMIIFARRRGWLKEGKKQVVVVVDKVEAETRMQLQQIFRGNTLRNLLSKEDASWLETHDGLCDPNDLEKHKGLLALEVAARLLDRASEDELNVLYHDVYKHL